jgi:DNA-binding LytR/AlgR family response regulator
MQICYNRQQEKPAVSDPKKGFYMRNAIDIDIQIDPSCVEPKVIIRAERMTPEIDNIVHAIESATNNAYPIVTAYSGDMMVLLSQREIIRVYLENRKLIAWTDRGGFVARGTLAEMEAVLDRSRFLRISRSELINLYRVSSFDFSLSGTIQVLFDDGSVSWVARRYVRAIQKTLGLV